MSDTNHHEESDAAFRGRRRAAHPDGPPVMFQVNRRLFWIVVPSILTLLSSVTLGAASWLNSVHGKVDAVEHEQRMEKAVRSTEQDEIKRRLDRIEKKLDRALDRP